MFRPDHNPLDRPTHPISAVTDAPNSLFWVSAPKARRQWVEWWVFFSKTRATRPDRGYIQIWRNQAQIWGDPTSSQPYLVRFNQIQPFPTDFSDFGEDFGDFDADLVCFYIFRQWFCRFRWWFCSSGNDSKPTEHTWSHPNPKLTRSIEADGRFRVTLLSTQRWRVGFKLGQKPTQPNPWTLLNIIAWLMLYYKVKRGLI